MKSKCWKSLRMYLAKTSKTPKTSKTSKTSAEVFEIDLKDVRGGFWGLWGFCGFWGFCKVWMGFCKSRRHYICKLFSTLWFWDCKNHYVCNVSGSAIPKSMSVINIRNGFCNFEIKMLKITCVCNVCWSPGLKSSGFVMQNIKKLSQNLSRHIETIKNLADKSKTSKNPKTPKRFLDSKNIPNEQCWL